MGTEKLIEAASPMVNRIKELEDALLKIYDEPGNTDAIIDIAYTALNGQV